MYSYGVGAVFIFRKPDWYPFRAAVFHIAGKPADKGRISQDDRGKQANEYDIKDGLRIGLSREPAEDA